MNVTLRRSVAVAALVLAPMLTSCGFGQPTDQVYTPGEGVNARDGQVDVLGALVVSGAEGSGTVVAGLVNNHTEPDALTEVSGPGITATLDQPVEIPATGYVQLVDETEVSVDGEPVSAGAFMEVTFTFESAESVTVDVPVVLHSGDYADVPVPEEAPTTTAPEESGEEPAGESAGH